MTNVQSNLKGFSLNEKATEILSALPEINESEYDYNVWDGVMKISFANPAGDFKLAVKVTLADTVETVEAKFRELYDEHMEQIERDNREWECPSETQGYAFDLLTC